ncbi:MAG: hypothetical protein GF311_15175 [Candidatus Lokiarchaeota archaeon]|nr:hypothetical protein [Candidatus Lokiarchaeota archaeon]
MIAYLLTLEKLTPIYDLFHKLDLKPDKTEQEKIKLRNLRRFITLFHNHAYCPLQKREGFEDQLFSCMMSEFGQITEYDYLHRCSSEFCNHCRAERANEPIEQKKIAFILNHIEGTILEQVGIIRDVREKLTFAKAVGLYFLEIDVIYTILPTRTITNNFSATPDHFYNRYLFPFYFSIKGNFY